MKKHITKTLSIALAALLLHAGMQAAASSSSSSSATSSTSGIPEAWAQIVPQDQTNRMPGALAHGLMRQLARDVFFKQLNIVRKNSPEITDPREIIQTALGQIPEAPPFDNNHEQQNLFSIISNNKLLSDFLGLSIQDLIDHNLAPNIWKDINNELSLDMRSMNIDDLTGIKNIPEIKSIQRLILADNQLRTIAPGTFAGLTNLRSLFLENNQLQTIAPGAFAGLINLQELSLDSNQLQTVAPGAFTGPSNLQELYLQNNQLQIIAPETFAELTGLQRLWLNNNQLQAIAPGTFAGLTNLRWLSLNDNNLRTIAPGAFAGLINLQILILNNNQLEAILSGTFTELTGLQKLWLKNNKLQAIAPGAFAGLTNLQELKLTLSHITNKDEKKRIITELRTLNRNIAKKFMHATSPPSAFTDDTHIKKRARGKISGGNQSASNRKKQARTANISITAAHIPSSSSLSSSSSLLSDDAESKKLPPFDPLTWQPEEFLIFDPSLWPNDNEPSSSLIDPLTWQPEEFLIFDPSLWPNDNEPSSSLTDD